MSNFAIPRRLSSSSVENRPTLALPCEGVICNGIKIGPGGFVELGVQNLASAIGCVMTVITGISKQTAVISCTTGR